MDRPENSPLDEARLLDIAMSIADGTPVDWFLPTSDSRTESPKSLLISLQCLERLVRGHDVVRSLAIGSGDASADDTLLTEARTQGRLAAGEPIRVQWGPLIVVEKIGRGSFGDVYRAWDPRLEREVALKLIPESASGTGSPAIEEGRLLARVRHPNVLTVHGAERIDSRIGIWTELILGETLAHEVAQRGALPAVETVQIGIDVCRALGAVHAANLLHRDIKAQNILRDMTGRVVLSDFGTGSQIEEDAGVSEPRIAGTPLYLAPEVCEGRAHTIESDLYGLGVLLYFLLTGSYPVRGRTFAEIRRSHASGTRVPLSDMRADLPKGLSVVIETLLAREPDRRYDSAASVERALETCLTPSPTIRPSEGAQQTRHSTRMRIANIAGLVCIVAAAALVIGTMKKRGIQPPVVQIAPADPVAQTVDQPSPPRVVAPTIANSLSSTDAKPPALRFEARDWVLIAGFENVTGEVVLDGTLEHALERELTNSPFVNVVPRERIEDVLELMRKPRDTNVDGRLGREVAVRDGAIRAVITGRVERVGKMHVLTAQIVNPANSAVLASVEEDAASDAELLQAVRRLAFRVREALGEMLATIRHSQGALEKVTTPSLHAAQLYSKADVFMRSNATGNVGPAETLLTQAVKEDPGFASAHILLALASQRLGRAGSEYLEHAARALALVDQVSDPERYFIIGTHHRLRALSTGNFGLPEAIEDWRQAVVAYEALLEIKPDHYWAVTFLTQALTQLRREPQATDMMARGADMRPTNLAVRWGVAQRYFSHGDWTRGLVHLRKAEALITPEFARQHPEYAVQIQQVRVGEAWLRRDVTRVRQLTDDLAQRVAGLVATNSSLVRIQLNLLGIYVALGRLRDAHVIAESLPPNLQHEGMGRVLFAAANQGMPGGKEALLQHLRMRYTNLETIPATPLWSASLVALGRLEELRIVVDEAKRNGSVLYNGIATDWFVPVAEARLALAEGRLEDSLRLFQVSTDLDGPSITDGAGPLDLLADAFVARGEIQRAISILEGATRDRWAESVTSNFAGFGVAVSTWIAASERLGELYRRTGRQAEGKVVDGELEELLAEADGDYPALVRLKARMTP